MTEVRSDYLVRATACAGLVRAFAVDSTVLVNELQSRHGTDPAVTAALGRLATGTLLFGAMLKAEDQLVTVRIRGNGPAGLLLASATGKGEVRGLVANPRPDIPQSRNGKLNVSGAVGSAGRLTVTRDLGLRQPYVSTVELVSGEIGEDLAEYLARSEQVPSAVGIGVFVIPDGSVEAAGGYIVQLMPGVADAEAKRIDSIVRELPHPTTMLRGGDSPEDILSRIFGDSFDLLDRMPVRFHCPCSLERVERAILLLGETAIDEMIAENAHDSATEVVCQFCNATYYLSVDELDSLRQRATRDSAA
ncbi:MAG TPA: Hsp33 family molecular chaperone HslO [Longimicrobiales bacterium]|nr:Hsp33 family molecular chaperone HslO [Longimicrobiales bacterium]